MQRSLNLNQSNSSKRWFIVTFELKIILISPQIKLYFKLQYLYYTIFAWKCHNLRSWIISNHINTVTWLQSCVHGCTWMNMNTYSIWYRRTDYWNVKSLIQKRDTCHSESILSNQMSKLNDLCFNQRFSICTITSSKRV